MYILIELRINGIESNELVSKHKGKLVRYLKEKGYYFSKKYGIYISKDIESVTDFKIEKIKEI